MLYELPPGDREYGRALLADPCAYCDQVSEQLDHILSASRGGGNGWDNLTGACARCNGSKNDRSLLAFLGRRINRVGERLKAITAEAHAWNQLGVPQ